MKNLQEIIKIVNRKRVKNSKILDSRVDEKTNLFRLFKGVSDGSYRSDREAAVDIFGTDPDNANYRKLKSNLKKRVSNNLFYLDINEPGYSDYHRALLSCSKNLAKIRILVSNGARNSGVKLAKKTLKQAKKYSFSEIIMAAGRVVKDHYSFTGQLKKFDNMVLLLEEAKSIYDVELLSENYYQSLIIHFAKSVSAKKELELLANKYYRELKKRSETCNSFVLQFNLHKIWLMVYLVRGTYKDALKVCDRFDDYLKRNPVYRQDMILGRFALYRLYCYLHLDDYKNGVIAVQNCISLFRNGSNNYFIFREYHFLLAIRNGENREAANIISEVFGHQKFHSFENHQKEKWRIFRAYFNYIAGEVPTQTTLSETLPEQYDLASFLRFVPSYLKDKKGYNIAILILQILVLLKRADYDGIIDRVEALRNYCSRWLDKNDCYRSNCFIKMVLIMEKEGFDYDRTKKIAAKYYVKLRSTRFSYQGTPTDLEVIHYEKLWKSILDELKLSDSMKKKNKKIDVAMT